MRWLIMAMAGLGWAALLAPAAVLAQAGTPSGAEAEEAYNGGGDALLRGLALFDRERAHMESAFAWLRNRNDDESAKVLIELAGAMPWVCVMRFHPRIRIEWQTATMVPALRWAASIAWQSARFAAIGFSRNRWYPFFRQATAGPTWSRSIVEITTASHIFGSWQNSCQVL